MSDTDVQGGGNVVQSFSIKAAMGEIPRLRDETEADYKNRVAHLYNNALNVSVDFQAVVLHQIRTHGYYRELGFSSMTAYMRSDVCPIGVATGTKLLTFLERNQSLAGVEIAAKLIGDLGVSRIDALNATGFSLADCDETAVFIHDETGAEVTVEQLKAMAAHDSRETLLSLQNQKREKDDQIFELNQQIDELQYQLNSAISKDQQELEKKLDKMKARIEELETQQETQSQQIAGVERDKKKVVSGMRGLLELRSQRDVSREVLTAVSVVLAETKQLISTIENDLELA